MKKLVLIIILVGATFVWYGFQSQRVNATEGSETSANFSGAHLTGAKLTYLNLTGVILDGVIFCNTTMPDGTINNTSCKN